MQRKAGARRAADIPAAPLAGQTRASSSSRRCGQCHRRQWRRCSSVRGGTGSAFTRGKAAQAHPVTRPAKPALRAQAAWHKPSGGGQAAHGTDEGIWRSYGEAEVRGDTKGGEA